MSESEDKKRERKNCQPRFHSPLLIGLDAWIDNMLYRIGAALADCWEQFTIFSHRFRVRGIKRLVVEVFDETLTLGLIGLVLFTAIGLSIFEMTEKDWRAKEDINATFLDRRGNFIGQRGVLHSEDVPIEEMPDYVIKAVLATEDRRFFDHWGIDFYGLSRALSQNVQANGVVQGGSTLTQQLAKNLFLTNERTLKRKIKEAYLAIWLEANLNKREILQLYLDRAYMGGGNFGIAAASKFYFGKDVRNLSLAEAAMLVGLFKAPGKYAPHVNLPAARARANVVLSNLIDDGLMTEGQIVGARRNPASVITRFKHDSPDYFLDWAFDEIRKMEELPREPMLVIRTTLDTGLQKAAEEAVLFHLRQYGKQYHASQAAVVILDNDGSVRAIVGGRDYSESQFNRATQASRQTGSSFKPYVYAVAMENGLTPKSIVTDAPINWGGWAPRNYGRGYAGRVDVATALVKSFNTVPVRIAYQYLHRSTKKISDLVKAMGVESPLSNHKTLVLGTSGMTVLDQATGFNVFANGGIAGNRHGFTQIFSIDGRLLWDWNKDAPKPRRVLSEKAAQYMNSMLVQVPERGTGRRAALPMTRVAGKTGTTQAYRDAWFVGYTGNYTAAVWMGNDNFSPMSRLTGGIVPAMIWQRIMQYAHQNIALRPIPGLGNTVLVASQSVSADDSESGQPQNLPQVLSPATTQIIREIATALKNAPAVPTYNPEKLVSSDFIHIR